MKTKKNMPGTIPLVLLHQAIVTDFIESRIDVL
jgi:hypothetical protein